MQLHMKCVSALCQFQWIKRSGAACLVHCDTGCKGVKGQLSRDTPLILAHASAVQAKALSSHVHSHSHTHNPASQQERSAASCKCVALVRTFLSVSLMMNNLYKKEVSKIHMTTIGVLLVQPNVCHLKQLQRAPETLLFGLGPEWTGAWSIGVE